MKYVVYDPSNLDNSVSNIRGFYCPSLHSVIPSPSIEITDEQHLQLIKVVSTKRVSNGTLVDIDKNEIREYESFMHSLRSERDLKIKDVEWLVSRHRCEHDMEALTTLSSVQYQQLLSYIQSLRDLPKKYTKVGEVIWPSLDIL
jgi:hypothetical protein